jgi:hypothetical protein
MIRKKSKEECGKFILVYPNYTALQPSDCTLNSQRHEKPKTASMVKPVRITEMLEIHPPKTGSTLASHNHGGTRRSPLQPENFCGSATALLKADSDYVRPPLWSSGQSFWLQIQRSRV